MKCLYCRRSIKKVGNIRATIKTDCDEKAVDGTVWCKEHLKLIKGAEK